MELPAALHALFMEATDAENALSEASPFQARHAARALLDRAMLAAGFPAHDARRPKDDRFAAFDSPRERAEHPFL